MVAGGPRSGRTTRLTARETAKFTAAVALFAIFVDAAIGHGLTWENDPYWSYWVTKTFLIATIFGLGTAWLGIGPGRGAAITAVHTVVLTVYYWTLAPIGLPSSPDWLDLEHTWETGLPIHFGVIYLGYLLTLWFWRRRPTAEDGAAATDAVVALAAAIAIVVVAGGAAALALDDFPGVTWYVTRLLLTVTFLLLWWAIVGRDTTASLVGALVLAFVWATYGEYVGPTGLPDTPLRIGEQAPPSTTVSWMDYRDLWLISVPIYLGTAAIVLALASRVLAGRRGLVPAPLRAAAFPAAVIALVAVALLIGLAAIDKGGTRIRLTASGAAQVERGPFYEGRLAAAQGTLTVAAEDRAVKVTPLKPHDLVAVKATVAHPNGTQYEIDAHDPLVSDPLGRHTTWWGVGVDVWHHGRSGIGTNKLPAIRSEVALFALGDVLAGGRPIAVGVPVHVMTDEEGGLPGDVELDVGDPASPLPGVPDGHLRVVWSSFEGGANRNAHWARYVLGDIVLALLVLFAFGANIETRRRRVVR